MAQLNADSESIRDLFLKGASRKFIIPMYQRSYSWTKEQCEKLWEDLKDFTLPEGNEFNKYDEYFLGSIVTFENNNNIFEVIDGQQRLTTLTLLLKAFEKKVSQEKANKITDCLWESDELENKTDILRIDSNVAYGEDKEIFEKILRLDKEVDITKEVLNIEKEYKKKNSHYIENFKYFVNKINTLLEKESESAKKVELILTRILNNCKVFHINANNEDAALRIFSTLNDRGLPLADADIFKAKMYGISCNKSEFMEDWISLEEKCKDIFEDKDTNPMDELFTIYMYCLRAGNKASTTVSLRKFFEEDDYSLLKSNNTISDLTKLSDFWYKIHKDDFKSNDILKRLNVLKYAPNKMWKYIVSVYYMFNQENYEEGFVQFLDKTIAFFWGATVNSITLGSCKGPIFKAMANIKNKENIELVLPNETNEENTRNSLEIYSFTNGRPITRAMLMWWSVLEKKEDLNTATKYDIEHIYSRNFQKELEGLEDNKYLEFLGNKSLLEKRVNIPASDNGFEVKCRNYYKNSKIIEMQNIGQNYDFRFGQDEIIKRNNEMIDAFIKFLKDNNVLATK